MSKKEILFYIAIILLILFIPLLFMQSDFTGVDAQVGTTLEKMDKSYTPWIKPFGKKLSGEMETFLFSLQSGVGAGVIGYILGYIKGRRKGEKIDKDKH